MTVLGLLAICELERVESALHVDVSEDLRPQLRVTMSVYSRSVSSPSIIAVYHRVVLGHAHTDASQLHQDPHRPEDRWELHR